MRLQEKLSSQKGQRWSQQNFAQNFDELSASIGRINFNELIFRFMFFER